MYEMVWEKYAGAVKIPQIHHLLMTTFQESKLLDFKAKIGEMFDDYLVIVNPEQGPPVAIGKNLDWCIAAAKSFQIEMKEKLRERLDYGLE